MDPRILMVFLWDHNSQFVLAFGHYLLYKIFDVIMY
jgi:hypothetical protein